MSHSSDITMIKETDDVIHDYIITEIRWNSKGIHGRLNLQLLPHSITHFDASNNKIEGPIDLTCLPPNLMSFDMSNNKIRQETVHVGELPKSLEILNLTGNRISQVVFNRTKMPVNDPRVWI
mmetsp:Transcript_21620/g.33585  ORF Transcript_21620/g.33585 Transcript_21620/m.33585 type:complete len:122 (-) Transcript_21620:135-500(-)